MYFRSLSIGIILAAVTPRVPAAYDAAGSNIAVYWGQNSYGGEQSRLGTYCSETKIDVIPLAFLTGVTTPTINFASAGGSCNTIEGSTLIDCPELEQDIKTCQEKHNKTIMLSIGGATYSEGGFSNSSEAETWADTIWALFGPQQSKDAPVRPFGSAVVDGFDFDLESSNNFMVPFASRLRSHMDAATDKKYYLSAAPQCVYPDAADNDMLNGAVSFDFLMIQYYNNNCGASSFLPGSRTQKSFNFDVWDGWAKNISKNTNVKLLLGLPASTGAASGYVSGIQLLDVIQFSKEYTSFGGVMLWDMTQLNANPGFIESIVSALGGCAKSSPSSAGVESQTTVSSTTTTTTTVSLSLSETKSTPVC